MLRGMDERGNFFDLSPSMKKQIQEAQKKSKMADAQPPKAKPVEVAAVAPTPAPAPAPEAVVPVAPVLTERDKLKQKLQALGIQFPKNAPLDKLKELVSIAEAQAEDL